MIFIKFYLKRSQINWTFVIKDYSATVSSRFFFFLLIKKSWVTLSSWSCGHIMNEPESYRFVLIPMVYKVNGSCLFTIWNSAIKKIFEIKNVDFQLIW